MKDPWEEKSKLRARQALLVAVKELGKPEYDLPSQIGVTVLVTHQGTVPLSLRVVTATSCTSDLFEDTLVEASYDDRA